MSGKLSLVSSLAGSMKIGMLISVPFLLGFIPVITGPSCMAGTRLILEISSIGSSGTTSTSQEKLTGPMKNGPLTMMNWLLTGLRKKLSGERKMLLRGKRSTLAGPKKIGMPKRMPITRSMKHGLKRLLAGPKKIGMPN